MSKAHQITHLRILFPHPNGMLAFVSPTGELSIEDTAAQCVPDGVPYKIVDVSEIPSDWSFRNAWETDFSNPDGYGIGADAWFAQQGENP